MKESMKDGKKDRPNILFIMSDDHAANAISIYKSRLADVFETKSLDRIGNEGAVFTDCYCANGICTPSRATILTGQHSHINGVKTLADKLPDNAVTFVDVLKQSGYQTGLIGKWHLHCEPRSFDNYSILADQGYYYNPYFISSGADWSKIDPLSSDEGISEQGYVTDIITQKTISLLEGRDKEKPFLFFCHHKAPHDNFEYHERYEQLFDGVHIPEPENLFEDRKTKCIGSAPYGSSVGNRFPPRNHVKNMIKDSYPTGKLVLNTTDENEITRLTYQKYLKDYLRTVKSIDDSVGELLDYLDKNGLTENTIVIYTSDQGMFLGEHDYIDKRWIYEEAMRMPLMIRYPRCIKKNSVINELVSNIDLAPTLLNMAGIEAPACMQGKSFKALAYGLSNDSINECVYYRYWMHMAHHYNPAHYGIRTKDYKLIFFYGLPLDAYGASKEPVTPAGWELYDLKNDPHENMNVYNDESYSEIVVKMKRLLFEEKKRNLDTDDKYELLAEALKNAE